MQQEEGLQLSDLVAILGRRATLIVRVAGITILIVFWVAMALPNKYQASSLILVEPQGVNDQLVAAGVQESDLGQRLGIMTSEILSRTRLSALITDFELYPDMEDWYTREEIVEEMRSDLIVVPVFSELEASQRRNRDAEFNTFAISFEYDSPKISADVVNSLAADYIEQHISARVQVSQKSLDFMRASMESLRDQILVVEAEIKKVKEANAGTLPEDLAPNQGMQRQTLIDLRVAQQALGASESDVAFWKNQILAAVSLSNPNDKTDPAHRRKVLEMQITSMKSRGYTDRHPDMIATRAELESINAALAAKGESDRKDVDPAEEEASSNYAEQNARAEYRRAKLRVQTGKAEVERLGSQLATIQARIGATPAVAEKLDGLHREHESLRETFHDFSGKFQQASVQADLERRQLGEQLRILEAAFPPPSPSSPNRPMILVLGLILGLGTGCAAAVLVESADTSLHGARDLQAATGIPVLAEIPKILLESDRAERARRIIRETLVTAMVVVTFLVGGVATYLFVNGPPSFLAGESEDESDDARPVGVILPRLPRGTS